MAEAVSGRFRLKLRAGIGNRDEAAPRLFRPDPLLHPFEKVLLEDVGFKRRSRFAGDNEQRVSEVNLLFEASYLRGIGGIEHVQLGEAWDVPKSLCKNL